MDDQILSVLEKRVAALEETVFGSKLPLAKTEITVVDALLNSHTMIKSALSCRDNVIQVLKRLPELNEFLDPTYPNNHIEIEAKQQYILLLYPELKKFGEQLKEFERVIEFADSDAIANVTTLSDKLDTIVANNVNTHLDSAASSREVLETINKYNDILNSMEVLLMQFDQSAAQIEEQMKPKKPSLDD